MGNEMSRETSPEWEQPSLLPPAVVEVTLKVGIVYSADLVMMQLEERSVTDGVLLAMHSVPARRLSNWEPDLNRLYRDLVHTVTAHTGPFI